MNRQLYLFVCCAALLIAVNVESSSLSSPSDDYDNLTTIFGRFADIISRLEAKVSHLEREKRTCSLEKRRCVEETARKSKSPRLTDMRVATGGHWGASPPLLRLVPPQMKILQMELHASDLAPLCSV